MKELKLCQTCKHYEDKYIIPCLKFHEPGFKRPKKQTDPPSTWGYYRENCNDHENK